jgi:O-succinylbenzoic acid--CoA ligase
VADVAVIGTPDAEWGELVTAIVVPANPDTPLTLPQLRAFCRDRLPPHAAPRNLRLVPRLPLLPNGKTDFVRLRAGT